MSAEVVICTLGTDHSIFFFRDMSLSFYSHFYKGYNSIYPVLAIFFFFFFFFSAKEGLGIFFF